MPQIIQYGACALHDGYLKLQTHTHNMIYIYSFPKPTMIIRSVSILKLYVQWLSSCEINRNMYSQDYFLQVQHNNSARLHKSKCFIRWWNIHITATAFLCTRVDILVTLEFQWICLRSSQFRRECEDHVTIVEVAALNCGTGRVQQSVQWQSLIEVHFLSFSRA